MSFDLNPPYHEIRDRDKNVDEQKIAERLRQNIPVRPEPVPLAPPAVATDEQSSMVSDAVNELGMLKLGNELGLVRPDAQTNERLKFIYEQLSAVSVDTSFESIMATAKDYLIRLGLLFNEDRFTKLFVWLKLNQERMAIDMEMANVRG